MPAQTCGSYYEGRPGHLVPPLRRPRGAHQYCWEEVVAAAAADHRRRHPRSRIRRRDLLEIFAGKVGENNGKLSLLLMNNRTSSLSSYEDLPGPQELSHLTREELERGVCLKSNWNPRHDYGGAGILEMGRFSVAADAVVVMLPSSARNSREEWSKYSRKGWTRPPDLALETLCVSPTNAWSQCTPSRT